MHFTSLQNSNNQEFPWDNWLIQLLHCQEEHLSNLCLWKLIDNEITAVQGLQRVIDVHQNKTN